MWAWIVSLIAFGLLVLVGMVAWGLTLGVFDAVKDQEAIDRARNRDGCV